MIVYSKVADIFSVEIGDRKGRGNLFTTVLCS